MSKILRLTKRLIQLIRQELRHVTFVAMHFADDGRTDPGELGRSDEKNRFKFLVQIAVYLGDAVFVFEVGGVA